MACLSLFKYDWAEKAFLIIHAGRKIQTERCVCRCLRRKFRPTVLCSRSSGLDDRTRRKNWEPASLFRERLKLVAAVDAVGSLFPEESCFADLLLIENDAMRQRIGNH
jgi:hypothetical protein